ncbi:hypothetical protein Sjap_001080 [Stephania japonica]|uniref:Uncharacterized protein n=1 Tax=Stephania japonica TaxID=461633 RepID=A0AAP0KLU2_9MAGN
MYASDIILWLMETVGTRVGLAKSLLEHHGDSSLPYVPSSTQKLETRIGNGERVCFRTDPWLGTTSLSVDYPLLFQVIRSQKSTVAMMSKPSISTPTTDWHIWQERNE